MCMIGRRKTGADESRPGPLLGNLLIFSIADSAPEPKAEGQRVWHYIQRVFSQRWRLSQKFRSHSLSSPRRRSQTVLTVGKSKDASTRWADSAQLRTSTLRSLIQ
jgi:hypothetical protein